MASSIVAGIFSPDIFLTFLVFLLLEIKNTVPRFAISTLLCDTPKRLELKAVVVSGVHTTQGILRHRIITSGVLS